MIALTLLLSALFGAFWRRWWGSARPSWLINADGTDKKVGYRGIQYVLGVIGTMLVYYISFGILPALGAALLVTGFTTLPISISRKPFEPLANYLWDKGILPSWFDDRLGSAMPWAEVFQGATLGVIGVVIAKLISLVV